MLGQKAVFTLCLAAAAGLGWCAASLRTTNRDELRILAAGVAERDVAVRDLSRRLDQVEGTLGAIMGGAPWKQSLDGQGARLDQVETAIAALQGVDSLQSTLVAQAGRIDRVERGVASLEAKWASGKDDPVRDPVELGKKALEDLFGVTDGSQQVALQDALARLVRLGDPVVPQIAAALDSGVDRKYWGKDVFGVNSGNATLTSRRMVLINALAQIGTPAAKEGLLSAVQKSRRLSDYRDLLPLYTSSQDPIIVKGIGALVPQALEQVAQVGVDKMEDEAKFLYPLLVEWIRAHHMVETAPMLEKIVEGARLRPEGWSYPDMKFFCLLLEIAPRRAADAVLRLEAKYPREPVGRRPVVAFSYGMFQWVPLTPAAEYYERVIEKGGLSDEARLHLYYAMPIRLHAGIKDSAGRVQDGEVLMGLLERRCAVETGTETKAQIRRVLQSLREAIARER